MAQSWTPWTAALTWGEIMAEWSWNHGGTWRGEAGDRGRIMVLLALAIQEAAHTRGIDTSTGSNPIQYRLLPLADLATLLTIGRAEPLVRHADHRGPLGGQIGTPEWATLLKARSDRPELWTTYVEDAASVVTHHTSDGPSRLLADRISPMRAHKFPDSWLDELDS